MKIPDNYPPSPKKLILDRIQNRLKGAERPSDEMVPYISAEFESDVSDLLCAILLPHSVLSGVRIFYPKRQDNIDYGFEMDALLHLRHKGIDWIVIVEAKRQEVVVKGSQWNVFYGREKKDVKKQVDSHVKTLWSYLEPIVVDRELKFLAIVVSSDPATPEGNATVYRNAEALLTSIGKLPDLLTDRFDLEGDDIERPRPEILRVAQSDYLGLLRLSLARPELGHPECTSALRYVERCRRALDDTLFRKFDPRHQRWAINGSAGMGKSVLLAYAAAVMSSGYRHEMSPNGTTLIESSELFNKIGFDASKGSIVIAAMSSRQLDILRDQFNDFVGKFRQADQEGRLMGKTPEFIHCRKPGDLTPRKGREWSALFVDEAHDLPEWAERELAEQYGKHGFYLVVACDRHQKLKLAKDNRSIIEGINFQGSTTRLKQVYRNPSAVYIASLALMFRWFAPDPKGPKILPTKKELEDEFGFEVDIRGKGQSLSIRTDVHPANSWSHTIATFPNVDLAFRSLVRERLDSDEVLWVRFSEEDSDFDYENLARNFTYHNCRSNEAKKISDKYIKGQDYPVVVIEGFPRFMDRFGNADEESKMWEFRRELYLCASRATCFLYFVCNVAESEEALRINAEISAMMRAISTPDDLDGGTKTWRFDIAPTARRRPLDVFIDSKTSTSSEVKSLDEQKAEVLNLFEKEERKGVRKGGIVAPAAEQGSLYERLDTENPLVSLAEERAQNRAASEDVAKKREEEPEKSIKTVGDKKIIHSKPPIILKELAGMMEMKPLALIQDLMEMEVFGSLNQAIEPEVAVVLCEKHGFVFEVERRECQP